jgi:hypothetical protein
MGIFGVAGNELPSEESAESVDIPVSCVAANKPPVFKNDRLSIVLNVLIALQIYGMVLWQDKPILI